MLKADRVKGNDPEARQAKWALQSVARKLAVTPHYRRGKTIRSRDVHFSESQCPPGHQRTVPGILLRNRDRAFFLKHVQQPGATNTLPDLGILAGSQYRIAANVHYLREKLEALNENRRDELVAFIVQHCHLVVVAVPTGKALVVQVMISLFRWSMSFLRGLKGEVSGKSSFPLQSKRSHRRNSRPQRPAPAGLCSNMPCVNSRAKPASARMRETLPW